MMMFFISYGMMYLAMHVRFFLPTPPKKMDISQSITLPYAPYEPNL